MIFQIKVQEPYPLSNGGQNLGALEVLPVSDRYIYSYKTSLIYYKFEKDISVVNFDNFFLGPQTRYIDSACISRSTSFNDLTKKALILAENERHLAVQPNHEVAWVPNTSNKKINLSNIECGILSRHIVV